MANDFFRDRRFIGSGDRRAVSDRVWRVLRARRRLDLVAGAGRMAPTPRLLVAASLLTEGWTLAGVGADLLRRPVRPDSTGADGTAALRDGRGPTLDHPEMPDAVRLEMPDWLLPHAAARFGARWPPRWRH